MNIIINNLFKNKFQKNRIIFLCLLILLSISILFLAIFFKPREKFIDLESSQKNFLEYNNQIADLFKSYDYVPNNVFNKNNNYCVNENDNTYILYSWYSFDDDKYCSVILSNNNGKEKFSVTMYSAHEIDTSYQEMKLLSELLNLLSAHHIDENDILSVIKGKIDLTSRITRDSKLQDGQHAHHYKWGLFEKWYIDYQLNDDNPIFSPELCDIVSIGGFTKNGLS